RTLAEVTHLAVHGVVIEGEELAGPADWCAIDLLEEDGSIRLLAVEHRDPKKVELAKDLRRRIPPSLEDATGVGAVIRTGQPEVTTQASDALIAAAVEDPHVRQVLLDLRLTSAIVVPLISRARVLGALSLAASGSGRDDGAEDLDLAQDIARLAAAAIDNARLYRERDHIARTLQQVLMPSSLPRIPGFDCAASYTPGRSGMEVGGDFYDVFVRPDGSFGIVIGDVSGKGPEAAAIMGLARQSVRAIGLWSSRPSEILGTLNQALLLAEHVDRFVTVCDARVRPDDGGA